MSKLGFPPQTPPSPYKLFKLLNLCKCNEHIFIIKTMNSKKTIEFHHKGSSLFLGGSHPVRVQSMTNTKTHDIEASCAQIEELTKAGCELVRLAVPDDRAAKALKKINDFSPIPLIADIHFDYRLAIKALEAGFSGLRINPGNIGNDKNIDILADCANQHKAVIRVGVNSGSVEKSILQKYGRPSPQALVESALYHVNLLEKRNFTNIKISLKSSSVVECIEAYKEIDKKTNYPLHIGITEAGTKFRGTIYSAVGIGSLLSQGIGNTLRVSLTADPVEEIKVAYEILKALELRAKGVEIISCPTCGRTEVDLIGLAEKIEKLYKDSSVNLKIAVMGCVVNGPGEAKEADIGIAGGKGKGLIFKKGQVIHSVPESELFELFTQEVDKLIQEKQDTKD